MKQLVQDIRTGRPSVLDVPAPAVDTGSVLVSNAVSLVSVGTERMAVHFARKNLLQKAQARPDLARQVLDKARRDGPLAALHTTRSALARPMPLGYASAGTVLAAGSHAADFQPGDRVACAGGGYAVHGEIVAVPRNLLVKLPDDVDFEAAAFTTLGAIALQGVRRANIQIGEIVAVIGLGLLGQITVQILKASGCLVIGMDIQPARTQIAAQWGLDGAATTAAELQALVSQASASHGADAVLITADTPSNEPVHLAGQITREKGVVVAVGAVGTTIPRSVYYQKELDFFISRSYGPGRYDPAYEEQGHDYPYGYVRWTEQRNMQAFVRLLATGSVRVRPLITHRFAIEDAPRAYELLSQTAQPYLGVLITYPPAADVQRQIVVDRQHRTAKAPPHADTGQGRVAKVRLGVIGAGQFATTTLLPILKALPNLDLVGIASQRGLSARAAADRYRFTYCTSEAETIINDPAINTVAILTRHHLHATQTLAALRAGKHVFVEKPLCLTATELAEIVATYRPLHDASTGNTHQPLLTVGYNRRFAPFVAEIKHHLTQTTEPLMVNYRINAGYLAPSHWLHDPQQGGGRLLGEVCHFIDLLLYLVGARPVSALAQALPDGGRYRQDNLHIGLRFADGSLAHITYVANGDSRFGKEYLEVFGGGMVARLDDFRALEIRRGREHLRQTDRLRQDKGHRAQWAAFVDALVGAAPLPGSFASIVATTATTLAAWRSLHTGEAVAIEDNGGDE